MKMPSSGTYTVSEGKGAEPIDAGVYPAKFVKWEEEKEGQYGPYLRLEFEITDGTSGDHVTIGNPPIGQWHYFTGVFDGNKLYSYLDGILVDSKT